MKLISILLASNHSAILRTLRPLLGSESAWEVCGETSNGREAVKMAAKFHPQIVVLDAALAEIGGMEAALQIKTARPETEVLMLTGHENEEFMQQILTAGARGYLIKSEAPKKIIPAIQALCEHRQYLASPAAKQVSEDYLHGEMKRA